MRTQHSAIRYYRVVLQDADGICFLFKSAGFPVQMWLEHPVFGAVQRWGGWWRVGDGRSGDGRDFTDVWLRLASRRGDIH